MSDGNDVVKSEYHGLRISMENPRLWDDCQREEHVRGSHLDLWESIAIICGWTVKPNKRCLETIGSMCSSSWNSRQPG